jgi:hypothetical protein
VGAVEAEADPGQLDVVVVGRLGRRRLGGLDPAGGDDVGERLVEAFQFLVGRKLPHPDHQRPVDETDRVVVGIEPLDLPDGVIDVIGDVDEVEIVGRDQPPGHQLVFHEPLPAGPVGAARHLEEDDGRRVRLARLHQREELEGLVHRPESAGQEHEAVRLLDEGQLPGEEVPEVDELGIVGDELAGGRLERQADVDAEGVLGAGPLDAGRHDPRPGAGDDHPVPLGHGLCEGPGLLVERVLRHGPGGPEDRHLALPPVGLEDVEGVAHLLEGRVGDLEVAPGGGVAGHPQGGHDHLEDEVHVLGGADPGDEFGDGGVEFAVAGSIAGESLHKGRVCGF